MLQKLAQPAERHQTTTEASRRGGGTTSLDLVTKLYVKSPHIALYTPLCKVKERLSACRYRISIDGKFTCAVIGLTDDSIEFTWRRPGKAETLRNQIASAKHRIPDLNFAPMIETGRRSWSQMLKLPVMGRYFRSYLSNPVPRKLGLPSAYEVVQFNPEQDLEQAAFFVNNAYPSLPKLTTPERLREMMSLPGFFPEGWFFLKYTPTGEIAGFAICGLCRVLKEGFIDWIQTSHTFRHRQLGQVMVYEAIRRLSPFSEFITSSGSLDAPFAIGDLYKTCGFKQTRQWTLLGTGAEARWKSLPIPLIHR